MTPITFIGIFWAIFIVFWVYSWFSSKRTVRRTEKWLLTRVVIIAFVYLLARTGIFAHIDTNIHLGMKVAILGVILCGVGVVFAIWARVHIGRNWGMPMSVKEDPELVTSGPYAHVRHPIYSGVLLAMFGSALASSPIWFVACVGGFLYFLFAATAEEKLLLSQFPNAYPDYKKRTKMLIPFVV